MNNYNFQLHFFFRLIISFGLFCLKLIASKCIAYCIIQIDPVVEYVLEICVAFLSTLIFLQISIQLE